MPALQTLRQSGAAAFAMALEDVAAAGLGPRDLVFLALSPRGAAHLVYVDPRQPAPPSKVGQKLTVAFPHAGPFYHFDAIHRLLPGHFIYNGDRRLAQPGSATDVAGALTLFLSRHRMASVFFGCTAHHPGCWLASKVGTEALHEHGFVEAVPVGETLVARRIMDSRLWLLRTGDRFQGAEPVFESSLGNILMLDRRALHDRLVLTCQQGLIEVDVSLLPWVMERSRVHIEPGYAVAGRLGDDTYAVTYGRPVQWGIADVGPAELITTAGGSLDGLRLALAR